MKDHIVGKQANVLQGKAFSIFSCHYLAPTPRYLRSNWVARLPGDSGLDPNGNYIPRRPLGWAEAYPGEQPSWAGTGPSGCDIPSSPRTGFDSNAEAKFESTESNL